MAYGRDPKSQTELYETLFGESSHFIAIIGSNEEWIWVNQRGRLFYGIPEAAIPPGWTWSSIWTEQDRNDIRLAIERARAGERVQLKAERRAMQGDDGRHEIEILPFGLGRHLADALVTVVHSTSTQAQRPSEPLPEHGPEETQQQLQTERDLAVGFIGGQRKVLALATAQAPLEVVLSTLIKTAEVHAQGEMLASILLMDIDGVHLRVGAAPSFNPSYNDAIDGMPIGPVAGSCGTAAYFKEPVLVSDIQGDPLWADFRDLARDHGLQACWSWPILSATGQVLGTLAYYFRKPRGPSAAEAESMSILVHTAALVLERHRELSHRHAVEAALRQSEAKLERFVNSNIIGIVTYVFDGANAENASIVEANDAFLDMLGYSRTELAEGILTWTGLTPPEWLEADRNARWKLRTTGTVDTYQKEFFRKDGSRATVCVGAANLESSRDEGIAYVLDISEIKKSAQAVKDSEAKFRSITNAMPQMVWSTLPDGHHDYYNDQWYEFTGVVPGTTFGDGWNAIFHPEDQQRARDVWQHSLETGESYEMEYRLRHHSGQFRWTLGRALPVRNDQGRVVRWMGTCTDIHDQRQAQEALHESSRRKDEFLAMLAHELRNPLAPISAAAELLRIETTDRRLISSVSQVITRQTAHMTGLIDDLLDVSRVTRGQISLTTELLHVRDLMDEALEQVRAAVEERRHRIDVIEPPHDVCIPGDEKRMVQILANLLGNAVKFTPNGGSIALRADVVGDQVRISVRDDGIGMTQELTNSVFEMFVQGERSSDRSQGGLGIGLALVKSLVTLHGGSVTAHSEGLGKGSEFTVSLPMAPRTDVLATPAETTSLVKAAKGLRVLLVDDNVDAAHMLSLLLESAGHTVQVAHHPVRALQEAETFLPDVCLLDIGLPEMNGNELALQMKGIPTLANALMIAVTGYGQPHDLELAFAHGFTHHFVKPVDISRLIATLSQHFFTLHPELAESPGD